MLACHTIEECSIENCCTVFNRKIFYGLNCAGRNLTSHKVANDLPLTLSPSSTRTKQVIRVFSEKVLKRNAIFQCPLQALVLL